MKRMTPAMRVKYRRLLEDRLHQLGEFLEHTKGSHVMMPAKELSGASKVTTPSDREIRIERIFNAPRERVWRALTDPELVAQWWGRGNKLVIERMEVKRGGHWRFVEHASDGVHGFEGRYREVTPPERVVQTFEWDGMPGHVVVETMTLEDLGDGRTKIVTVSLFHTTQERDGMLQSDMEQGLNQSYAALDKLLARLG
ncbi:SRPBCC family protein [Hyalangium gracile]|uniref:SRPBCC family protein n=1 Tax=Hyalangium gracile TaxID=394092 RepID=UPI001CCE0A86|nr:SRPBCC family protein [Hyalangium gracile]